MENGLDAHCITDHGNANHYAYAALWAEKWNKENADKPFKYVTGVEFYFHPDLEEWKREKEFSDQAKEDAKARSKMKDKLAELETKIIMNVDGEDEVESIETSNSLTIENEEESKSTKAFNPVNRRHHLVILPKNPEGLKEIFSAVSWSYLNGFYRFPRIDAKVLKKMARDGNVIVQSACLAGLPSFNVFRELQKLKFDELDQKLLDDPVTLEKCVKAVGNAYDLMTDCVGIENYFLELQFNKLPAQNLVNRAILEFAKRNGATKQLIATCDAHYPRPEMWKEREMYKKLGYLNYINYGPDSLPKSRDELKCELYPKNAPQMWDEYLASKQGTSFYDDEVVKDAIERSHEVVHERIGQLPPDRTPKFANSKLIPEGKTPIEHLVNLCKEGLVKRGLQDKPGYIERLKEELGVIKTMKNADYFINYQKVMELARKVCLCGPARGSGGGSLVNYVLYITDIDPMEWELPFSRFLSVQRKGYPDIDSDLGDRDKVLDELRKFFGYTNVAPISNYNTFKLKSLVKDLAKFAGVPFEEANVATRSVEQEVRKATHKHGDDKNLFVLKYEDAMSFKCVKKDKLPEDPLICSGCTPSCEVPVSPSFRDFILKYPQVAESMKVLFKQNKSLGRHAGGVLIVDDLPNKMPLIASKGEPQTPWVEGVAVKHLEYIGNFLKLDLLGIEVMRLVEGTIRRILQKQGNVSPTFDDVKAWFDANMAPDKIDLNDQKVYEYVYHEGRWPGIFQCTSSGAQKLFMKAKPRSIIDIAALTSIYRPGPLSAKVDKMWLDHEEEPFDWGHPLINDTLKDTRGLLVFQEGVMALVNKVSGFPLSETDEVRRAIMKRSISGGEAARKKTKELEDSIVNGAINNGVPEDIARKMYQTIVWMSGYGFNKSHAVAYAIDSYWSAWLLTHYEEEWICAYLDTMMGSPENKAEALGYVKQLGYEVKPLDINYAGTGWVALPGKKLMPSLTTCKSVGTSALEEILANRPYRSLEELLYNEDGSWRHSKFNRKTFEALVKVKAFDSLGCVGPDKLFKSYRHMFNTLFGSHVGKVMKRKRGEKSTEVDADIDHHSLVKRHNKGEPYGGRDNLYVLAEELAKDSEEWDTRELGEFQLEYFGNVEVESMVGKEVIDKLTQKGVKSIDEWEGKDLYWFCVKSAEPRVTKNKKSYLVMEVVGPAGITRRLNVWSYDGKKTFSPYAPCIAEIDRNDFGHSTTMWRLKELT